MKKNLQLLLFITLSFFCVQNSWSQCSNMCRVDLQNDNSADPTGEGFFDNSSFTDVNASYNPAGEDVQIADGNTPTATYSFDIFNQTSGDCNTATDGVDDVTMTFTVLPVFDPYGGGVGTPGTGGQDRYFYHDGVGVKTATAFNFGPPGNSFVSTTGDTYCYEYRVEYTTPQIASDAVVRVTSINTAGQAFESANVIFLNGAGNPYGVANYQGFWNGAPIGSNGGTNNTMINAEADIWVDGSGTNAELQPGVFVAADPNSIDAGQGTNGGSACFPENGSSGTDNNETVEADTDSGLNATDIVTGFIYTVCLEDVATTEGGDDLPTNGGAGTSSSDCTDPDGIAATNTQFLNTLSYFELCNTEPCDYTYNIATTESCGEFTINITGITGVGSADPVTSEAYDVLVNGANVLTNVTGTSQMISMIGGSPLTADGSTTYSVEIRNNSDNTCISDPVMFTAPNGVLPNCGTFPANPSN